MAPRPFIQHLFTNHPPISTDVGAKMDRVTELMIATADEIFNLLPPKGDFRENDRVLAHLQEASMWAKASLARHQ